MEPKQWVGIDVSGKRLEVFVRPIQRMLKVANSPAELATLVSELLAIYPALIMVEATANWHLATVAALSGAGLPVAVINRARRVTLPEQRDSWPRLIQSTHDCWLISLKRSMPFLFAKGWVVTLRGGSASACKPHAFNSANLKRNRGAFLAKNGTDTWRYQQKFFYNGGQYDHE